VTNETVKKFSASPHRYAASWVTFNRNGKLFNQNPSRVLEI